MNKKYEVAVNLQQDFTAAEQTQGRDNIGAASASDVAALQSQVSSLSDVSAYSVKGEATVAQLNAGPSGIQAGWAYQLTDSGTLTEGTLAVVAGDTVAWDGTKWFPLVKSDYYATKTYAQNVAHSIAPEFVPNSTTTAAGMPYMYNGSLYIAKEDYYGVWDASKFIKVNLAGASSVRFSGNPEYKFLVTDKDGYLVFGIKYDGNFVYGKSEKLAREARDVADTAIAEWYNLNYITDNPEYKFLVTDKEGYLVFGINVNGEFVYGKSSKIEESIKKSVAQVKSSNIVCHKNYNSNSINDTIDMTGAYGDYAWFSVLAGKFYETGFTYSITIVGGTLDGTIYTGLQANRYPQKITIGLGCTALKFKFSYSSSVKVALNIWNYFDYLNKIIKVSSIDTIADAHFLCDGVNDEEELQQAVMSLSGIGCVEVSAGDYYIDSLPQRYTGEYGAVVIHKKDAASFRIKIQGVQKHTSSGTRIHVRDSAFSNLPADTEAWIFGASAGQNVGVLYISDLAIMVDSNSHKFVAINGQYLGGLVVDNCRISAGANEWSNTPPSPGSVGVRGVMGDCNGTEYLIKDTYCVALYEGFQLGGEHLIMTECGTRFCYYGYTFGNYDYGSWYTGNPVTDSHPLTLINCCDEGSRALPKFAKCGVYSESGAKALQAVDMISFNLEIYTVSLAGAEETTPGSFCGRIEFTGYGSSNSSKTTTPSATRGNRVDIQFWANGSGENFKTINTAHKTQGTTAERLGYWAQLNQQFFDTDLNKMLVCIDEEHQTWVDMNGNSAE